MTDDIVITGIGIVNSLGHNLSEIWHNLVLNKVNYRNITNYNPNDYPPISHITMGFEYDLTDEMIDIAKNDFLSHKHMDKVAYGALYVAHQAMIDANIQSKNGAVIFSSTSNNRVEYMRRSHYLIDPNSKRYNPKMVVAGEQYFYSGFITGRYELTGTNLSLNSACTTGLTELDYAIKMLLLDDVDFVLIGNSETNVEPNVIHLFDCLGAIDKHSPCRPFDKNRQGISVGDGAISLIIEKRSMAEKRGAHIYCSISALSTKSDKYHPTSMSPNAYGVRVAIEQAIKKAQINYTDIDYINAHATATPLGDEIEYAALEYYFPNSIVNSVKGYIGHLTATSALTELAMVILQMNNSKVIKCPNVNDPITNKLEICLENKDKEIKYALKTSLGFGGNHAAVIIKKE